MNEFEVRAEAREERGKGAIRRLRRTGKVPGVIYGGDDGVETISMRDNELRKQTSNEAFFSHILTVSLDGKKTQAVVKAMQRHPATYEITHVDFLRINATESLTMRVPLHFINEEEAPGRKAGGVFSHLLNDLEISCLPRNLPEYIAVDLGALEIGDNVHLSNLVLPEGVTMAHEIVDADHDHTVAMLQMPQVAAADGETVAADGEAAAADDAPAAEDEPE
ncbi:MAG: large subunit ribosomal protein L25 [Gammaproteobacteria bacterium]|jgi:large subunit ribosomal protein L25